MIFAIPRKVSAMLPLDLARINQAKVGFVNERSGLKRMSGLLAATPLLIAVPRMLRSRKISNYFLTFCRFSVAIPHR
jgi:hypothetical protein